MTIKLDVTLDTNTTPPYLDVDEQNNSNHIGRNTLMQTIKWKLTANASEGTFNSPSDPNVPGFQWLPPVPPSGVFGAPELHENGKAIKIPDLNNSEATTGTWFYQLAAVIDGQTYRSGATALIQVPTNPSIRNN